MLIALTNDDGIYAVGLRAMYSALITAGHTVCVIAPLTEQSAVGHAITVLTPLRVKPIEEAGFSGLGISGTPTDCVKLGISQLMPQRPDLIISGINAGANVGPDVLYSGTVAAATEGASMGLSSLAVSHNNYSPKELSAQAEYVAALLPRIPWAEIPKRRVLNLNLPDRPVENFQGLALCPQTDAVWNDWYDKREDPRGRTYWWLDGNIPMQDVRPGTDKQLLEEGWATLTPLKFDFTDHDCLKKLKDKLGEV